MAPLQFRIDAFDNAAQFAVAQNDEGNEWAGGQWSRFDWTVVGEEVWYCQTIWDAASSDEAAATPPADGADPAMSGCGGAPWSRLVPVVEE